MDAFQMCIDANCCSEKPSKEPSALYEDYYGNPRSLHQIIFSRIAYQSTTVSQKQIEKAISNGQTICPSVFNKCPETGRPRRTKELWVKSKALFWDFDKHIEGVENVRKPLLDIGLDFTIIHKSYSWTEECQKYHGIILLEDYITDDEEYEAILAYVGELFEGQSDQTCFERARLFFSGPPECVVYSSGYRTSGDYILSIMGDAVKEQYINRVRSKQRNDQYTQQFGSFSYGEFSSESLDEAFAEQQRRTEEYGKEDLLKKNRLVGDLEQSIWFLGCFDGRNGKSRYKTVWNSARALAQTGFWVPQVLHYLLKNAIMDNKYFDDWDKDPDWVINSGMEYGLRISKNK